VVKLSAVDSSPDSDAGLVLRAREGDRGAFRELYARHARFVAALAFRMLGREDEVDDVVQDSFIAAARGLDTLREPAGFRYWLRTIGVRTCIQHLRQRKRRDARATEVGQHAARSSNPEDAEAARHLYQVLDHIPDDLRVPWILYKVEGLNLNEVAQSCDVSLATIKRRLRTADERIERRLKRD
jgi:RNA polymerase sigma-70 factor (ECF subfamily)